MHLYRIRKNQNRRRTRRGFTLMEIIIVVIIIALLATLVAPQLFQHFGRSQVRVAQAGVARVSSELRLYLADHGMSRIPNNFDLNTLVESGRLRAKDLLDPWGNPYGIMVPGEENIDFDIVSFGADGQPGGEDQDADIRG